jgi:hypothetical protein
VHILAIVIVLTVLILLLSRGGNEFEVLIQNGKIKQTKGRASQPIINDFAEAIGNVAEGRIIGKRHGKLIRLDFRGDIDDFTQQRLRNILGLHQR